MKWGHHIYATAKATAKKAARSASKNLKAGGKFLKENPEFAYGVAVPAAAFAGRATYQAIKKHNRNKRQDKQEKMKRTRIYDRSSGNMKYLAFKRGDKKRYEGTYSQALLANKMLTFSDDKVAKVTTKFERDIKIASPKRARDTFKKLYNNDSEFRKIVTDVSGLVNEDRNSGTRKQAKAFKALEKLVKGKSKNFPW